MAVGRLKRVGTNILAVPYSTSVSLETLIDVKTRKGKLLFTAYEPDVSFNPLLVTLDRFIANVRLPTSYQTGKMTLSYQKKHSIQVFPYFL